MWIKQKIKETIDRMMNINTITMSVAAAHRDTFLPYKNMCKGEKDIVICGAGPSLQKYIPIVNAIHIAVNRAFLYEPVDFDIIFAQDYDGIRMVQDDLISYKPDKCVKFLARSPFINSKTIPESFALKCNAKRFICDYYIFEDGFKSKMVLDLENRPLGGMPNVGMSVMQFGLYMNPRKLYIVGCDMSGTHFAPGHQSDEQLKIEKKQYDSYWSNEQQRLIEKWKEIKEFAEVYYPETEIITVNPVGLRGIFKDYDQ